MSSIDLAHDDIEIDLGVELLPSPVATILSGMFIGPATTTSITFARFESTVFAEFLACRFLQKDSCSKTEFENAVALRALRLRCVTSDKGAFLNIIESSLHACTSWGVEPKQSDLGPRFAFGYVFKNHKVGKSFDEESKFIQSIAVPVNECVPQFSVAVCLSQDTEKPHYNNVTIAATVSNMEVRALETGTDVMNIFYLLTPMSQYASLIPVKSLQAKYNHFTDIKLAVSAVSIILTDRPESKNHLFGYHVNGKLHYSCAGDVKECAVVEAGPLWIGLYDMDNEKACQPEKTQFTYNRFSTKNGTVDHNFTIVNSICKLAELDCVVTPTGNDSKRSWASIPAVMLQRLFEQVHCESKLHWPSTSTGPASLHECFSKLIMSKPYISTTRNGSTLDVINLSYVEYRSEPSGNDYLPTIVNNTDILENVCTT